MRSSITRLISAILSLKPPPPPLPPPQPALRSPYTPQPIHFHRTMPHQLNHDTHGYLAVTFSPTSSLLASPSSLSNTYPGLEYKGQVGELTDVHLYSMPKNIWLSARDNVLGGLQSDGDVLHVEEQVPRYRNKRGGDEL